MNFEFNHGPTIISEDHGSEAIDSELRKIGISRPLVVTDQALSAAGIVDPVLDGLSDFGYNYVHFDEIEANPTASLVERGTEVALDTDVDGIIAVGGGSTIDTAKAISLLVPNGGDWTEYEGTPNIEHGSLPLIAIPTTIGTGSEVTRASVITDTDRNVKMTTTADELYPDIALLDPTLLQSLPPAVTAATGMDSLTQAIEAYISPGASPITDALAIEATRMIAQNLGLAFSAADYDVLATMQVATTMGGMAFDDAGLGLVHGMSEPVSGAFHTGHGITNAVLLPSVLEFNLTACVDKYAALAEAIDVETDGLERRDKAEELIRVVRDISDDIGIPAGLAELGVEESAIPELAAEASDHINSKNNPREYDTTDLARIYHRAF